MILAALLSGALVGGSSEAGVVKTEFIFETAPFAQCHASTIAETGAALAAAWFGGTREGKPDVAIWVSRNEGGSWSAPVQAADGVQADGSRFPCWNPVLFQPKQGPLLLFYKVGPSPGRWWGMLETSEDGGRTWSPARRLPEGILGPIKNKPLPLRDGTLLCPSSSESDGWRVHFERTLDLGKTWEKTGPLNDGTRIRAIQPALLTLEDGTLLALCRSRQGAIAESRSTDGGKTWGTLTLTALPNPNSGLDAVTLADGRHLLVYNHSTSGRTPLNLAVSADGSTWRAALTLEDQPGEYSYPAVIQARDRTVHLTYTWNRVKVKHVVIEPARLVPGEPR